MGTVLSWPIVPRATAYQRHGPPPAALPGARPADLPGTLSEGDMVEIATATGETVTITATRPMNLTPEDVADLLAEYGDTQPDTHHDARPAATRPPAAPSRPSLHDLAAQLRAQGVTVWVGAQDIDGAAAAPDPAPSPAPHPALATAPAAAARARLWTHREHAPEAQAARQNLSRLLARRRHIRAADAARTRALSLAVRALIITAAMIVGGLLGLMIVATVIPGTAG